MSDSNLGKAGRLESSIFCWKAGIVGGCGSSRRQQGCGGVEMHLQFQ